MDRVEDVGRGEARPPVQQGVKVETGGGRVYADPLYAPQGEGGEGQRDRALRPHDRGGRGRDEGEAVQAGEIRLRLRHRGDAELVTRGEAGLQLWLRLDSDHPGPGHLVTRELTTDPGDVGHGDGDSLCLTVL